MNSLLRSLRSLVVAGAVALASQTTFAQWKPVEGNMMTQWAKNVDPKAPWPEHPQPQLERKTWTNLNGLWDYSITEQGAAKPATWDGQILVPYPIESALSGVKKPLTNKENLWYHRTFAAPQLAGGQRLLLHFGAVDWESTVTLNGKALGTHRGGYDAFTYDITDSIKAGDNDLVLSVFDATGGYQPKGKQHFPAIKNPGGIMYTPCSGIWQTVWLEVVAESYVDDIRITPDLDGGKVVVKAMAKGKDAAGKVKLTALADGKTVASSEGTAGQDIALKIDSPKVWTPDTPFLYDLTIDYGNDSVHSYFGMRKVSVGKDDKGFVRILLNNKFVFQVGFLDQGFWPDGIYTAPTDEALRWDIEATKKLGMNMARKHVKVEPQRWYYWADKLGLIIWQDMPAGGFAKGTTKEKDGTAASPEADQNLQTEMTAMVQQHMNHPSIIMWIVFNEGWGQYDTPRFVKFVKDMDPSRLVSNASGWHDRACGDIVDMHNYPGPGAPKSEPVRASVLGEFGGLGFPVPGHTWVEKSWGYRSMTSQKQLTNKYIDLLKKSYELKDSAGLNAVVYTQTTDCETECNGLITYDRAIIKTDLEKTAAANRGTFPPAPQEIVVVPTSQKDPINWRYTIEKPADNWFKADFDAAAWKEAPAGFGNGNAGVEATMRTPWKTADIWVRREFDFPDVSKDDLMLRMLHDEDADVYINGVLAVQVKGYNIVHENFEISKEGKDALKTGKNTIAIHCHQTMGGQYIDAGFVRVIEAPAAK